MQNKILAAFFLISFLWSCKSKKEEKSEVKDPPVQKVAFPDFNVALQFINDYTRFCLLTDKDKVSDSVWINQNILLTQNFKRHYKALVDSAWKADSELGLDFDPIFDAQDFPDKGFSIAKTDSSSGYVTVAGKEWKDFFLNIHVVLESNRSLVDGAGVINIPFARRAQR